MTTGTDWRGGVTIARGQTLDAAISGGSGILRRATAVDFSGAGGQKTWIGAVSLEPKGVTGAHHHGRHEVMLYVVKGRSQIRWGERLEFAAEVGPRDFIYFAPHVPHQEMNLSTTDTVDFVVVRSDNERINVMLDTVPVERPETIG